MDPIVVGAVCRLVGFPRTRGDGPPRHDERVVFRVVSPARAGMDPLEESTGATAKGFPRTRGDGPCRHTDASPTRWFPPHARGWTRLVVSCHGAGDVSPARAGMDPYCRASRSTRCGFPRTRGDGPSGVSMSVSRRWFPPHARGWTGRTGSRSHGDTVSPARAGMDPPL